MFKKLFIILFSAALIIGCTKPTNVKRNIDLNKLVELHNTNRAGWNIKILHETKELKDYANKHANWMLKNNKLKHSSMSGISKLGYNNVGENIAWNQGSEEEVINAWLWSPGHRANILSKDYDSIGCGVAYDDNNIYWCVVFGKK